MLIVSEIYQYTELFSIEDIQQGLKKLTWINEKDIKRCLNRMIESGSVKKSKGMYQFIDSLKQHRSEVLSAF
jgi:hypothetical protein